MTRSEPDERVNGPTPSATGTEENRPRWRRCPKRTSCAVDAGVAAVLVVVAYQVRRHGLPHSGLWLDDTVEAAAVKAPFTRSLSVIFTVSGEHPGFILGLSFLRHLGARSDASLAYPAFIAGALGPALLFVALRRFAFPRSVSALLSAALAAAEIDIIYSGRVKTHVIDPLLVLAVALLVPWLARRRWQASTGIAWVAVALVLASIAGYVLLAVAVAGIILAAHPVGDFRNRAIAVGVQELGCGILYLAESRTYDGAELATQWRHTWDAFPSLNPASVAVHSTRIAEMFPGGPTWLASLTIVAALAGLAIEAANGRHAVLARYLLLLLATALFGGLAGVVPFGPKSGFAISSGMRAALWLIPVVAIGLALAAQRLLSVAPGSVRAVLHTAAYGGTAAILLMAVTATPWHYPFPGAKTAAEFVESNFAPHDAIIVPYRANWALAAESSLPANVVATPGASVGFRPAFPDPRVIVTGLDVTASSLKTLPTGTERILVYQAGPSFNQADAKSRLALFIVLSNLGFALQQNMKFDSAQVQVWHRS